MSGAAGSAGESTLRDAAEELLEGLEASGGRADAEGGGDRGPGFGHRARPCERPRRVAFQCGSRCRARIVEASFNAVVTDLEMPHKL
jgi:hypothetical protein